MQCSDIHCHGNCIDGHVGAVTRRRPLPSSPASGRGAFVPCGSRLEARASCGTGFGCRVPGPPPPLLPRKRGRGGPAVRETSRRQVGNRLANRLGGTRFFVGGSRKASGWEEEATEGAAT